MPYNLWLLAISLNGKERRFLMAGHSYASRRKRLSRPMKWSCHEPESTWDDPLLIDDELLNEDELEEIESVPDMLQLVYNTVPSHSSPPGYRWPVWERRVRLMGEARIDVGAFTRDCSFRLDPQEVRFTSPPALDRQIIVCGFVIARLAHTRRSTRQVALPFQTVFTAWPVRDNDRVTGELLSFAGSRVCPLVITHPDGQNRRTCDLKVAFDAIIRVQRPVHR